MIVQQQVELICCLSRDSELMTNSKNFPSVYWPLSKETPLNVMSLKICLLHVKETPVSIKRVCSITNTADSSQKMRTVVLMQHKYGPNATPVSPPRSSGKKFFQINYLRRLIGNSEINSLSICQFFYL